MNEMKIFNSEEFGQVRTVIIDGEVWFVGKDVCKAFGDKNHNRSLGRVDEMDKREMEIVDSLGRTQKAIFVNESGLYALLFSMQPQKANNDGVQDAYPTNKDGVSDEYPIEVQERIEKLHRFKRWVTSEVLPSIRKTGKYETNNMHSDTTIPRVKGSQTQIPKNGNWYDKVKPKIKLICEVYGIEIKKLYHIILTNIQGVYNWDFAMMTYINETGSAPRYPMQVVAHFQQF